jgi:hypothetical protein
MTIFDRKEETEMSQPADHRGHHVIQARAVPQVEDEMYFSWRKGETNLLKSREISNEPNGDLATLLEASLRNVEPVLTGARFGATAQIK